MFFDAALVICLEIKNIVHMVTEIIELKNNRGQPKKEDS